ncbi:MAG: hypothetical protein N2318_00805 [Meiothermus sp.]|nr:hypothetical protein [Meiothermus sp.]
MASHLLKAGLDIAPVVGEAAAAELAAYEQVYEVLPGLTDILEGRTSPPFPEEPSARYALTMGLAFRAENARQALNAFRWMVEVAPSEWVQLLVSDLYRRLRQQGLGEFALLVREEPRLRAYLEEQRELVLG